MLLFLTSRLRQWLLFAVAVPLLLIWSGWSGRRSSGVPARAAHRGSLRVEELGQRKRNRPRRVTPTRAA